MHTPGTSPDANVSGEASVDDFADAVKGVSLLALLERPTMARSLADIDDPLEGCDSLCRSITYGRVGDPAGTHTREQCKRATVRAFGYQPEYVNVHSEIAPDVDGEDEGREA
jgi:hypothetical protein